MAVGSLRGSQVRSGAKRAGIAGAPPGLVAAARYVAEGYGGRGEPRERGRGVVVEHVTVLDKTGAL